MYRRSFMAILPGAFGMAVAGGQEPARESLPNRPKVPGTLGLRARRRAEQPPGSGKVRVSEEVLRWEVAQSAVIIVDMWDTHPCSLSVQRIGVMAPRMNQVVSAARSLGVMIIHAPSSTMKYYAGRPERLRMQQARRVTPPFPIKPTLPDEEELRKMPIDGGCDDPIAKKFTGPVPPTTTGFFPWERENAAIDIAGYDGISDSGQEIYNFCNSTVS